LGKDFQPSNFSIKNILKYKKNENLKILIIKINNKIKIKNKYKKKNKKNLQNNKIQNKFKKIVVKNFI